MADIKTLAQFRQILSAKLKEILNNISEKVYEKLIFFIDNDIYATYRPKLYDRTYEFRNKAWVKSSAREIAGSITATIKYDGNRLSVDEETYTHIDRDRLAEILNRNSVDDWADWDFGRREGAPYPEPFFDHTLEWINNNWKNLVLEAIKKAGFKMAGV